MTAAMEKGTKLQGVLTILCALALILPTVAINQCFAIIAAVPVQEEHEETKQSLGQCSHRVLRSGGPKSVSFRSNAAPVPPVSISQPRTADARVELANLFVSLRC
jgi:hypothetical protein